MWGALGMVRFSCANFGATGVTLWMVGLATVKHRSFDNLGVEHDQLGLGECAEGKYNWQVLVLKWNNETVGLVIDSW